MVEKIKLKYFKNDVCEGCSRTSYRAPLSEVLIHEAVLKMLFQKQELPEECK